MERGLIYDVFDLVFAISGILVIVFRASFARYIVRYWNTKHDMRYGPRDLRMFQRIAVVCGVIFILYSIRRLYEH